MTKDEEKEFNDWFVYTAEMLVDDPDAIRVDMTITRDNIVRVRISGPRNELGKIVGKEGSTVLAIRHVATAMSRRLGAGRVYIRVRPDDEMGTAKSDSVDDRSRLLS